MRIQVNDFNFKSTPGRNETGFIAQQLYTVLPEVVRVGGLNPATDPWMVDYGRVTPLLTKAIQEQQGEIETLKQQNKNQEAAFKAEGAKEGALEKENAELKARVAYLETSNSKLTMIAAEMEALKKAVTMMQKKENGSVRTAALEKYSIR